MNENLDRKLSDFEERMARREAAQTPAPVVPEAAPDGEKKCDVRGCDGPGDWRLVFRIPPPAGTCADPMLVAAEAPTSILVCSTHAKDTKVEDVLTDDVFEAICEGIARNSKVRPLREDVVLDAVHRSDPRFDELDPDRIRQAAAEANAPGRAVLEIASKSADYERERMIRLVEEWWHSGKSHRTLDTIITIMRTTPRE